MALKIKDRAITSGRQLALALGVGESTVREYLERGDWPVRRVPPWTVADVAAAKGWQATLQEDRAAEKGGTDPQQRAINTGLKLERMKLVRAQRQRLERELIPRALLNAAMEAVAKLFVDTLTELERALPLQLAGMDAGQIEKHLADRFDAARDNLANRKTIELASVQQKLDVLDKPKERGRPKAGA